MVNNAVCGASAMFIVAFHSVSRLTRERFFEELVNHYFLRVLVCLFFFCCSQRGRDKLSAHPIIIEALSFLCICYARKLLNHGLISDLWVVNFMSEH